MTAAFSTKTTAHGSLRHVLATALHDIGGPVCAAAAEQLIAQPATTDITLHMRNAEIDAAGAARLASALASVSTDELARFRSFSLSYNPIGDAGAIALAKSLPSTLPDLGLVGCSIGDAGMQAMLDWAETAAGLRMICIENNTPAPSTHRRFQAWGQTRHGVSVYI